MTALYWILGVVLLLFVLLCLTRLGVWIRFGEEALHLAICIGVFRFTILPQKEKVKEIRKTKTVPKKEKKPAQREKLSAAQIKDLVRTIWPPLIKALRKIRRGIRVDPLQVVIVVGGEKDPADAAQLYGYLHAVLWGGMPVLEEVLYIPNPDIRIGLDFEAQETVIRGECGISARVGTLLLAGLMVAIPATKWLVANRKKAIPTTTKAAA